MPPDPIEYRIIRNLQTALLAIAVAGGYHFDVGATAVRLDPNVDVESLIGNQALRPFLVIDAQPESWEYFPASQVRMVMPVIIHWVSEATELTDEIRARTFFRGCADVEQALAADITLGGVATDIRIVKRHLDSVTDGAQVWAIIETEVRLNRTYGKPNG